MTAWYAIAIAGCLLALREQLLARRLRVELRLLRANIPDGETQLLRQNAIPLRLQPQLRWAAAEGTSFAVMWMRVLGPRPVHAARALARTKRAHEGAYVVGPGTFVTELWGVGPVGAHRAARRLAAAVRNSGHDHVEFGIASFPADGADPDTLIDVARLSREPLLLQPAPLPPRLRTALQRTRWVLGMVAARVAMAIAALVGVWLCCAGLLALAPTAGVMVGPVIIAGLVGSCAACAPIVRAEGAWILLLFALFAASIIGLQWVSAPSLVQGLALLLASSCLGASIAQVFERLWWTIPIVVLVACVDLWSVLSSRGVTRQLVDRAGDTTSVADLGSVGPTHGAERILDALLFRGPTVGEAVPFAIGAADLVFMATMLALAVVWQLGVVRNAIALAIGGCGALAVSWVVGAGVPAVPLLAIAFLVVNARLLQRDVRSQLAT